MRIKPNILNLQTMSVSSNAYKFWTDHKDKSGRNNAQLMDNLLKHAQETGFEPANRDTRKDNIR